VQRALAQGGGRVQDPCKNLRRFAGGNREALCLGPPHAVSVGACLSGGQPKSLPVYCAVAPARGRFCAFDLRISRNSIDFLRMPLNIAGQDGRTMPRARAHPIPCL